METANAKVEGAKAETEKALVKTKETPASAKEESVKEESVKEESKKETTSLGNFHNPVLDLNPTNVASTIKSNAEQRLKDDYQMQDYEVQQQTSAYNQLKNVAVDSEVKQTQMKNALSRWGYDFEMVQYNKRAVYLYNALFCIHQKLSNEKDSFF